MSVQNRRERTAKRTWIPLVFGLLTASPLTAASFEIPFKPENLVTLGSATVVRADGVWEEFMDLMLDLIMTRLDCGPQSLPEDVPVAMAMVAECYMAGGLADMTAEQRAEFLLTVDETNRLTKESPASVSQETREKLLTALRLMSAEVEVLQ